MPLNDDDDDDDADNDILIFNYTMRFISFTTIIKSFSFLFLLFILKTF